MADDFNLIAQFLDKTNQDIQKRSAQLDTTDAGLINVLDQLQNRKQDVLVKRTQVATQTSQVASNNLNKAMELQQKLNDAGPFHDVVAFFTGDDSKEDMQEKQQMLGMQVRRAVMEQDYLNSLLDNEDKQLESQRQHVLAKYQIQSQALGRKTALLAAEEQTMKLKQVAQMEFIANKFTIKEMEEKFVSGNLPQGVDPGLWETILIDKKNKLGVALSHGKDKKLDERIMESFGNDVNTFTTAVRQMQQTNQGFVTAPNGAKWPANQIQDLYLNVSKLDQSTNQLMSTMASLPVQLELEIASLDDFASRVGFGGNLAAQNPELGAQFAELNTQTERWANARNRLNTVFKSLDPVQQQMQYGTYQNITGQLKQKIDTFKNTTVEQLTAHITDKEQKAAAQAWLKYGDFSRVDVESAAEYTIGNVLQDLLPAQRRATGGVVMGDLYSQFVGQLEKSVVEQYKKEGKSVVGPDGRIDTGVMLQLLLEPKNGTKLPSSALLMKTVTQQDEKGNYVWENGAKKQYAFSAVSSILSDLARQYTDTAPQLAEELSAFINPANGMLDANRFQLQNPDSNSFQLVANALTDLDVKYKKLGVLKAEQSLVDMFKQRIYPTQTAVGLAPSTYIEQGIDRAKLDMGTGAQIVMQHLFKGRETAVVGDYLLAVFSQVDAGEKMKQKALADAQDWIANNRDLIYPAGASTGVLGKNTFSGRQQEAGYAKLRDSLLQTYPPDLVDETLNKVR